MITTYHQSKVGELLWHIHIVTYPYPLLWHIHTLLYFQAIWEKKATILSNKGQQPPLGCISGGLNACMLLNPWGRLCLVHAWQKVARQSGVFVFSCADLLYNLWHMFYLQHHWMIFWNASDLFLPGESVDKLKTLWICHNSADYGHLVITCVCTVVMCQLTIQLSIIYVYCPQSPIEHVKIHTFLYFRRDGGNRILNYLHFLSFLKFHELSKSR